MKKIIFTTLMTIITVFSTEAQTPEQIYAAASKNVQIKMDENKKNGKNPLKGITAEHVFKIKGPINYSIADLDVHLVEAPGMIHSAMNLNISWSKIRSLEFHCNAIYTLDEIKAYLAKVNVTITKDKVTYTVQ